MGFDCAAVTVIGLRITEDDLIVKKIEHRECSCSCKLNNSSFNYCHECGHKNNKYFEYQYVTGYVKTDDDDWTIQIEDRIYNIIQPTSNENLWYITLDYLSRAGPRNYEKDGRSKLAYDLETLLEMKNQMKIDLTTIGVWNDAKFGIYTLIDFSF